MSNLDTDSRIVKKDSQTFENQQTSPERAGETGPRKVTEADLAAQETAIERTLTAMGMVVPPRDSQAE